MTTGSELRDKFDLKWGRWRKFIAANPLTGTWITLVIGLIVGTAVGPTVVSWIF